MYYDLSDLGLYYTAYSADFAAKKHAKASGRDVFVAIFDDINKNIGRKIYHPSGKVEVIFYF